MSSRVLDDMPGCTLAWSDEFDGPEGSSPDPATWKPEIGGHGWGNRELQFYTEGENASLDGMSNLVIEVHRSSPRRRHERHGGRDFTSARLISKDRVAFRYGVVQARMRLPGGRGIWPAFWMLGQDLDQAGWPGCGEIDVMENFGTNPAVVQGTVHGPGYSGARGVGASCDAGLDLSAGFHEYCVAWEPARIRWYLDDRHYATVTPGDVRGNRWMFDHDFFLLLNVAVGGVASVAPDTTTAFPRRLLVDYVRVYSPPGEQG